MSYLKYYSPAKRDHDLKDKTISQLKSDILELQQNEKDFNELSSQLKNIEYRYTLLQEEKERMDLEYRNRNEVNLKLIASLRTDVDALKSTISEKNIEIQAIRSEFFAVQENSEEKAMEIVRLKKELQLTKDRENQLVHERGSFEEMAQALKAEKRQFLDELDSLNENFTEEINKNNELERIVEDLLENKKENELKIEHLQGSLENCDKIINDSQRTVELMGLDLKASRKEIDDLKEEAVFLRKTMDKETGNSKELGHRIAELESNLREKDAEIASLKRNLDVLNANYCEALENNALLAKDEENSKKIIENLSQNNTELLGLISDLNDQDDQIRELLERKSRINGTKRKIDANFRTLLTNGN